MLAETKGDRQLRLRKIAGATVHQSRLTLPVVEDAHASADSIAIRFGADQAKADAAIARRLIVAKQIRGPVVCGHQNVEVAVAVKVTVSQPRAHFCFPESAANLGSDIAKFSITAIEKE